MALRNDATSFTTDLGQRERSTEQIVTRAPVTAQEDKALVPGVIVVSVRVYWRSHPFPGLKLTIPGRPNIHGQGGLA